jgi:hypothetical protein
MSILTDTIRKQFKEGDDIRDEGLTTPDTVQRFDNILYGDDPEWNTMDLYIPKEEKKNFLLLLVSMVEVGYMEIRKDINIIA